jgi:hypothetical protein
MLLNPIGVLDLSVVTELLITTLTNYWPDSQLWSTLFSDAFFKPNISGLTPDAVRTLGGCQLTISLIHIEPSKSQRNLVYPPPPPPPPSPFHPRAQMIPQLPLGLDLYYFVTAFSDQNYQQEQQAISIVLNCFHQNPFLTTNVTFPSSPAASTVEKFTLTMEIESVDSISRFWQATTSAFRLSVMYRVAVVFLTPPPAAPPAPPVAQFTVTAAPASFPVATNGQVFGTSSTTTFISPNSTLASPENVQVNYSPATVTYGQTFYLNGAGLNQGTDYTGSPPNPGTSYRVYLLWPADFSIETEVTQWKRIDSPTNPIQTSSRMVLVLPSSPEAGAPTPGVYMLRAGSDAPADAITFRTNSTPFSVAAQVNVPGSPPSPMLTPEGGIYTITGVGFLAGSPAGTELMLDTVPLIPVADGSPSPGEFVVTLDTEITFQPPSNLAAGLYAVRLRVNGIESPPALWIQV